MLTFCMLPYPQRRATRQGTATLLALALPVAQWQGGLFRSLPLRTHSAAATKHVATLRATTTVAM